MIVNVSPVILTFVLDLQLEPPRQISTVRNLLSGQTDRLLRCDVMNSAKFVFAKCIDEQPDFQAFVVSALTS